MEVDLLRGGKKLTIPVTLGTLTEEKEASAKLQPSDVEESLGLRVEAITPELARRLRLDNPKGVVVSQVAPESPAAEAGVQRGDIVREINRQPVTDMESYTEATARLTPTPQPCSCSNVVAVASTWRSNPAKRLAVRRRRSTDDRGGSPQ